MESELNKVRQAALARAAASGTLDDIDKAASIAKAVAEAEKSATETQNSRQQLQLQLISSISTFLIPVVSLLTMFGTIYVQNQQLKETQRQNSSQLTATLQQNEDTQWRDLLISLHASPGVFDLDVTVAPRLRSFFNSPRYGDQAKDISIRLMGRLTNAAGFKDLYEIVFADVSPEAFLKVLNVARSLNGTRDNIETECANLSVQYKLPDRNFGICTLNTTVGELSKAMDSPFPQRAIQLRQALTEVYAEMMFISEKIGPYLKANYPVGPAGASRNGKGLDLSRINFFRVDLSNVDFSNASLENTIFWDTNFAGAHLRPKKYTGVRFFTSNWWDALVIDQNLLNLLIQFQYPFSVPNPYLVLQEPSQEHYTSRIAELCQPMRPVCMIQNLKFR